METLRVKKHAPTRPRVGWDEKCQKKHRCEQESYADSRFDAGSRRMVVGDKRVVT